MTARSTSGPAATAIMVKPLRMTTSRPSATPPISDGLPESTAFGRRKKTVPEIADRARPARSKGRLTLPSDAAGAICPRRIGSSASTMRQRVDRIAGSRALANDTTAPAPRQKRAVDPDSSSPIAPAPPPIASPAIARMPRATRSPANTPGTTPIRQSAVDSAMTSAKMWLRRAPIVRRIACSRMRSSTLTDSTE